MSDLISPDNNSGGSITPFYSQSKIEDYNLADKVIEWHLAGFKNMRIATKCNDILNGRNDGKEYIPINHMNVKYFLESKYKEVETAKAPLALQQKAVNVVGELEEQIVILRDEIDKIRKPGDAIDEARSQTFLRLMKELNRTLEICANVQGKVQPSITLNVFQTNISKFCQHVVESNKFSSEQKATIIDWAASDLIPENELKNVTIKPK